MLEIAIDIILGMWVLCNTNVYMMIYVRNEHLGMVFLAERVNGYFEIAYDMIQVGTIWTICK